MFRRLYTERAKSMAVKAFLPGREESSGLSTYI